MGKRYRKKKATLDRATPMVLPGSGGLIYVPAGQQQGVLGQTFYGSSTKNVTTGQSALFSPGTPLPNQPGVNPGGFPVQFRFPVAVNTFPVDRTSGSPDIPSFQQLRNLAKLYNGVTLCERAWFDMVPRMKLKIALKQDYIEQGAEEKEYRKEITFFLNWFESPDKMHDQHSWLRMSLREQTQIDELYLYKRKKRGGGLYALEIHAGDQFKPLLDDWGRIPQPPSYAYQQYPWGLPGRWFRTDEMIHYQESPAADNPYGQSRVERIIMLVNQALRKQKKDLSHFTEGNIPQGIMKVPENAQWTPDQIDAFEQAWNALLAGNSTQQVRMRFTQPGMEYQAFEQYALDPSFDKFILNIAVSAYGLSMQDLAFTEDIHKSSGDSQQNVTYRRTIDPLARVYASFFTQVMNNDFPPELHGDMFEASFTGFEEEEDLQSQVTAYSEAIQNATISPANVAKKLGFPDIPETGPLFITKGGIVPLASFEIGSPSRKAQDAAQLAGLQLAGNPQPSNQDDDEEPEDDTPYDDTQTQPKRRSGEQERRYTIGELVQLLSQQMQAQTPDQEDGAYSLRSEEERVVARTDGGTTQAIDTTGRVAESASRSASRNSGGDRGAEYRRWRQRAIDDVKEGRLQRPFTTTLIPDYLHATVSDMLEECSTIEGVKTVFQRVRAVEVFDDWQQYEPTTAKAIAKLRARGVKAIRWNARCACERCASMHGEVRAVGTAFSNGSYLPPSHDGCGCDYEEVESEAGVA